MYEPRAVTRVTNPEDVSHHGLVEAVSGSASRIAQLSVSVFAELNPPCRTSPLPGRAVTLLEAERLLMVFPEGARGTAKLYGDRNSLVDFGSGFVRLALQARAPIIPFAFVGGGEAIPTVVNLVRLGRLFGVPYIPLTPWLLPVPRRTSLELYYDAPIVLEGTGNEEDEVIFGHVERVKSRIAALMESGLKIRRGRREAVRS